MNICRAYLLRLCQAAQAFSVDPYAIPGNISTHAAFLNFHIGSHADFIYFDDFIAFEVPEANVIQVTG